MRTAAGRITLKNMVAVIDATFAVAKRKPELYERITKSLTFFTIISAVVRHILIDLSTTGWTSSCTARSIAGRTNCFR